jgi:uncharacterized protein (DUF427 family)
MMPVPDPVGPGQESVWDYPRPPRLEVERAPLRIVHRGITVAETAHGLRTLETSHPPTYYFPPDAIAPGVLQPSAQRGSFCEWKGRAAYWDVVIGNERLAGVGWSYPQPTPAFAALQDFIAFYAAPFDAAFVGDERVTPQPGGFYGGWITTRVAGPFKGVPGSQFW